MPAIKADASCELIWLRSFQRYSDGAISQRSRQCPYAAERHRGEHVERPHIVVVTYAAERIPTATMARIQQTDQLPVRVNEGVILVHEERRLVFLDHSE